MWIWAVFAVMAAGAVAILLRPLVRQRDASVARAAFEAAVYRDQMSEIERDVERGVLSEAEAESARTEVARRLLASDRAAADDTLDPAKARGQSWRRAAAAIVIVLVPVLTVGSYLSIGAPELPAQPFAARQAEPAGTQSLDVLVARVERHLQANPEDGQGWQVIGPAYMRLRRFPDAVIAFEKSLALNGPSAERYTALGEARVFSAGGLVDAAARGVFEQARDLDQSLPKPRYYLGLAALQEQKYADAIEIWEALIDGVPEGIGWAQEIRRQIADARTQMAGGGDAGAAAGQATAPPLDRETMDAASEMSSEDRQAMIEGMVSGLDERLRQDGGTVDEWLRLVRAYVVMGRREDATEALERARTALGGDAEASTRLSDGARELGLGS